MLTRPKTVFAVLAIMLGAMAAGYVAWTRQSANAVPQGFVVANGRIEAQEIDVAAKYGGRIVEVTIQEGDDVAAGAVIARLDSDELNAAIARAEAQLDAARQEQQAAAHSVTERESQLTFTGQELERTKFLSERGYASGELLDKRRSDRQAAEAAHNLAMSQLRRSEHAARAADAEIQRLRAQLDQTVLKAPRQARVLYRLALPGEVVAAGGKVATLVDLADMRMTVFLAGPDAGAVAIGSEARIVLDSMPTRPIPARASFVSPTAQFTPKTVETQDERTKLVFRVKAIVTDARGAPLKSGMPGVAYFRLDEHKEWPAWLK
ncbi:MAG: HlyD family efflux transporter periplasmic adaptor subunit [Bradyrhizobium sp.]|uniref:HlyD family secretion protein n=1 Tax=Bradyrhizobium sp. TaxID=376 RepID=UPI0025C5C1C6|nr:HlyD family efflux transporter periplasmic adaptor subunit [Bradyrhizobium sp.]MBI5264042.1 HlyD family efflux transporter periplasmic adaptor subunit [Bradyrhizobium sp.]